MKNISLDVLKESAMKLLKSRGIFLEDIASVVFELQKKYHPELNDEIILYHIDKVLSKREVCNAILVGLTLDELAEKKMLPYPLQDVIENDESLFGIDEIIPLSITNVYGTIALTNFGYLDKEKIGLIADLDSRENEVHTFSDDIVAAIVAATASRMAHKGIE